MEILGNIAFWSGAILCLPCGFLLLEVVMGLFPGRRSPVSALAKAPRSVLLIPAHDEQGGLGTILERLGQTDLEGVQPIVLADNCSDQTAQIARDAGVDVWERENASERGKPFALAWALDRMTEDPPEVVLFLDADTWFHRGGPATLARCAAQRGMPVQAINRIYGGGLRGFAFRFRNEARLRGLKNLGAPTQLSGTGFALPWKLLADFPLPVGELAEDASWGWNFARAGIGPYLTTEVEVLSNPPGSKQGEATQVRRWEHGILAATLRFLPGLLRSALLPPSLKRMFHLADVLVPPLALLVLICLSVLGLGAVTAELTVIAPTLCALSLLGIAVLLGWWKYGRADLPLRQLLTAPLYAVGKIGVYGSFLFRRQKGWQRTERDDD